MGSLVSGCRTVRPEVSQDSSNLRVAVAACRGIRRSVPLARILVFALALTHAVGIADLVMDDACGESCEDDGCGDDCLPGVACRCHCSSAALFVSSTAQPITAVTPPRAFVCAPAVSDMHASPDPHEILHVPRRAV